MQTDRRGFVSGVLLAPLAWFMRKGVAAPESEPAALPATGGHCDCCDVEPDSYTVTISGVGEPSADCPFHDGRKVEEVAKVFCVPADMVFPPGCSSGIATITG